MLEIRLATPADDERVRRLAERDSAAVPDGPLLIAEVGGDLRAALALDSGAAIADPFAPTAKLVAALRACAEPPSGADALHLRVVERFLRHLRPDPISEHADLHAGAHLYPSR